MTTVGCVSCVQKARAVGGGEFGEGGRVTEGGGGALHSWREESLSSNREGRISVM